MKQHNAAVMFFLCQADDRFNSLSLGDCGLYSDSKSGILLLLRLLCYEFIRIIEHVIDI